MIAPDEHQGRNAGADDFPIPTVSDVVNHDVLRTETARRGQQQFEYPYYQPDQHQNFGGHPYVNQTEEPLNDREDSEEESSVNSSRSSDRRGYVGFFSPSLRSLTMFVVVMVVVIVLGKVPISSQIHCHAFP